MFSRHSEIAAKHGLNDITARRRDDGTLFCAVSVFGLRLAGFEVGPGPYVLPPIVTDPDGAPDFVIDSPPFWETSDEPSLCGAIKSALCEVWTQMHPDAPTPQPRERKRFVIEPWDAPDFDADDHPSAAG